MSEGNGISKTPLPVLRVNGSVIYIEERAFLVDMNMEEAPQVAEVVRRTNLYPQLIEVIRACVRREYYDTQHEQAREFLNDLGEAE